MKKRTLTTLVQFAKRGGVTIMALELYDCYIFFSPILLMALELYDCYVFLSSKSRDFQATGRENKKTWRTFLSFLVEKSILWVSFCIKISFDYISSEKYIFYFHNMHSVNLHNHSLARCYADFSDLARIM